MDSDLLLDRGVSDQQRNQILGHARSDTFLKHYMSSNAVVDVQATFLGTASRMDLIKQIGKLCLRRDPLLPKKLSDTQRAQAHQNPDVARLRSQKDRFARKVKDEFTTLKAGRQSTAGKLYKQVQSQSRTTMLRVEREEFARILYNFHSVADLDFMVAQLNGEKPKSEILAPVLHLLDERRELAHSLFEPATESGFAQMVETMARLVHFTKANRGIGTMRTMLLPASAARHL